MQEPSHVSFGTVNNSFRAALLVTVGADEVARGVRAEVVRANRKPLRRRRRVDGAERFERSRLDLARFEHGAPGCVRASFDTAIAK